MSLFKDEQSVLGLTQLDRVAAPVNKAEGHFWNDVNTKAFQFYTQGQLFGNHMAVVPNITPVTNTNATSATTLQSLALPAGLQNAVGKTLYVYAAGTYNLAAASTQTYSIKLGSVVLMSFSAGNNTNTSVALPWNLDAYIATATKGATGTVESHGILNINIGATAPVAITSYNDGNTAVSSAIDLTAANTLAIQALLGTGNASSTQTGRMLLVEMVY